MSVMSDSLSHVSANVKFNCDTNHREEEYLVSRCGMHE
jgi:hypothetical protein